MASSNPVAREDRAARRPSWPGKPRAPLERGQVVLLILLLLLTVAAWALTIRQAQTMQMPMGVVARGAMPPASPADGTAGMGDAMVDDASGMAAAGMAGAGWSLPAFVAFTVAWAVMMAAMMFPAAAPMLLLFRTLASQQCRAGGAFATTWVFAAGYLLVWTAIGGVTWALVQGLSDVAGRLGLAERATWGPIALGVVLVVAGLYQLTPLKRVCLDHCRSPFAFVMQHWRPGVAGALRMGVVHGLYCLGCCWALFAVLVAAGVMSLAWMLVLTLVVFAEKVLPFGRPASIAVGVAFLVLGAIVATGTGQLPGMA